MAFFVLTTMLAVSPSISDAEETAPKRPGDALIESLQNRSAVDRWILLRREQRQLRKQNQFAADEREPVSIPSELPKDAGPSLSKPFPVPGMTPPEPADARPIAEFSEPVVLEQAAAPPNRRTTVAQRPDQLRKITEIMPYHDYSPDTNSQRVRVNKDKVPEEFWTTKLYSPRKFEDVLFTWEASNLYHNPLYFEDPALERYGHTYPDVVQPFASIGRFGVQLVGIPYQMTIDPICSKHYTLGWYRPGECAPKLLYQIPWNARAAKVQAGVMTGMFFLIP